MEFRICRRNRTIRGRRSFLAATIAIVLSLELLVRRNPLSSLSTVLFCYGHEPSSSPWSSSSSSFSRKQFKQPTASPETRFLLGSISNENHIAAWAPQRSSRSSRVLPSYRHRLPPCVGYYIPSPTTLGSRTRKRRSSILFSKNLDETDYDGQEKDFGKKDEESIGSNGKNNRRNDILSLFGNVSYGANRVHKDFLALAWNVYSRTFLFMAPFVVLMCIILPRCRISSSPSLQLLALKVLRFLNRTFEILAEGSRVFWVRPMHGLVKRIVQWCSRGRTSPSGSVWRSGGSTNTMIWGLFWGPIVEELVFRFAFRGLWKALFRPIAIGSTNSKGSNSVDPYDNKIYAPPRLPLINKIPSFFRRTSHQTKESKSKYTNQSWRIASGVCFGIAHFSNFFPINANDFTYNGEIQLPNGTIRERFLLGLFPSDFASHNKEFCLVSMHLVGAVYQATHCFINTILVYGPLMDTPRSQRGGLFAAIGAHIAWNANTLWFVSNIKLRLLFSTWKCLQ